jgi:GAF domain-containing protein
MLAIDLHTQSSNTAQRINSCLREPLTSLLGAPPGRPKAIQDLKRIPDKGDCFRELIQEGVRSFLAAPLCHGEATLGVLSVLSNQAHAFHEELIDTVQEIADSLAFAIQHLSQHKIEQQRLLEAEAMRDVMAAIASAGNLSQILEAILVNLGYVVRYDRAGLFLMDENQRYVLADQPSPGQETPVRTYLADDPLVSALRENQRPVFVYDIQEDPQFDAWTDMQSVRGWLGAPLLVGDEMIGILSLGS